MKLAPHETLELHEILQFKNVCCTKSSVMQAMVTDPKLKKLLQDDVTQGQQDIRQLRELLSGYNVFQGGTQ